MEKKAEVEFREINYERDREQVVKLIQENLRPEFTLDTLKWKHEQNYFGTSVSTVAVDGDKVVAVVFATRYDFVNSKGERIKGMRTFDGCTDNAYRGKGIFKKLMQFCIGKYEGGYDFFLANPNEASFKEHLKIGYVEPKNSNYYYWGILMPSGGDKNVLSDVKEKNSVDEEVPLSQGEYYHVGNTLSFVKWRYQDKRYRIKQYDKNGSSNIIVYRHEKLKGVNSLVLCDFLGDPFLIQEVMSSVCKAEKNFFVYFLENLVTQNLKFLLKLKHRKALIVLKENNFSAPDNLVISLGDLEGIL
ncbi:GNAT family N-acetyltransferase [Salinimicrobium oceani]|uniref:GNAT family N-acetyltransferase n=1 Tax=Salinimicrobium oceani TaxID=2722702 RepID=A0ABX1D050_9FLAO|nr:GNAT family N-acetyltransferase [Salinimicrobium oceani]NJW53437.1 GNAT family N-acetyltransferase [Salinimicrobium oceani]